MDARKHLIIIKGKDQTDSVASFQFHDGKCEVVYTSAPNKTYSFQSSNVEILPLKKKIDPAQVIVTINGQTISEIDELLDFGGYYRIVRNGKRDLSFRRSEVRFRQNCLTDGKNQEAFQYFKETAAAISLVAENGINILSMQYDKIQQVSEDTVLASYLAPQKDVKMPQMPEAVIYPFGLNQSQKLAVERALSSKISIIQGPPGTGKTQTILNIIANVVRSGKTVAVVSNNNSATHNVAEKLEKKNASFLTAFLGSLANKERFLDAQTGAYPNMSHWEMPPEERQQLDQETTALSKELNEMLNVKNRIAEIEQEFLQLNPEQHYFEEYYASYSDVPMESLDKLSSQKLLALWMEFEQHAEHESRLGLLQKLSIMFRFNRNALKLFLRSPELVIPYLQSQFYSVKRRELEAEKQELNRKLERYAFDAKMDELTQKSLWLFRAELATRYHWQSDRRRFEKNDFRRNSVEFTREYPVVLSTTYSIKGTLSIEHIYDYLIVDEASQVDLATGVLAGVITIPIGSFAGGLAAGFPVGMVLRNLIPIALFAVLIALGLAFLPNGMVKGFQVFGRIIVIIITIGLAAAIIQKLTPLTLIPGMNPISEGVAIVGDIAVVLAGAFPLVYVITRVFKTPLMKLGHVLGMNDIAAAGLVATLANNIPMFQMLHDMDRRGKIINVAFAVSAAFVFGDHLGFTAGFDSTMIFPMIVGKLVGGVTAVAVAMLITRKYKEERHG